MTVLCWRENKKIDIKVFSFSLTEKALVYFQMTQSLWQVFIVSSVSLLARSSSGPQITGRHNYRPGTQLICSQWSPRSLAISIRYKIVISIEHNMEKQIRGWKLLSLGSFNKSLLIFYGSWNKTRIKQLLKKIFSLIVRFFNMNSVY